MGGRGVVIPLVEESCEMSSGEASQEVTPLKLNRWRNAVSADEMRKGSTAVLHNDPFGPKPYTLCGGVPAKCLYLSGIGIGAVKPLHIAIDTTLTVM